MVRRGLCTIWLRALINHRASFVQVRTIATESLTPFGAVDFVCQGHTACSEALALPLRSWDRMAADGWSVLSPERLEETSLTPHSRQWRRKICIGRMAMILPFFMVLPIEFWRHGWLSYAIAIVIPPLPPQPLQEANPNPNSGPTLAGFFDQSIPRI